MSADHDPVFLNQIAQTGSDLGNFIYVPTGDVNYDVSAQDGGLGQANYAPQVTAALQESLEMAMEDGGEGGMWNIKLEHKLLGFEKKMGAQKNHVLDDEEAQL